MEFDHFNSEISESINNLHAINTSRIFWGDKATPCYTHIFSFPLFSAGIHLKSMKIPQKMGGQGYTCKKWGEDRWIFFFGFLSPQALAPASSAPMPPRWDLKSWVDGWWIRRTFLVGFFGWVKFMVGKMKETIDIS